MTSSKVNREVVSADAELTDWDGHITILEQPVLTTMYNGNLRHNQFVNSSFESENRDNQNLRAEAVDCTDESGESIDSMSLSSENDAEPCNSKTVAETSCYSPSGNVLNIRTRDAIPITSVFGRNDSVDAISRPPSSWVGSFYQQMPTGSSVLADSITEILNEDCRSEHEPTSAILDYCKRKFLRPYMIILSLVGLNPVSTDITKCRSFLSFFQCLTLGIVLIFGYFLQYLSSYRGDRGFSAHLKSLHLTAENASVIDSADNGSSHTIGELLFGFIIPFLLDLIGYGSAVICCKFIDQEQLQNLIERTFLMSMQPKRLCRFLWLHIGLSFCIFGCLYAYVVPVVVMQSPIVKMKWLAENEEQLRLPVKILLLTTLAVQDIIEVIILSSYCIECYLLKIHLLTLSQKLLLHSIDSLDWMREVLEFRKLLDRLNNHVSIPVSFFIVMNLAYASAGFVFMFKDFDFHYSALKLVILNFTNVILWLILGLLPFFMAASLTQACQSVKANGHQIRIRPFVYHNTSTDDLNSMLMFASSLDMSAKLFRMPIQSNYLCFAILVISIVILTLGMCFNLSLLGIY